MKSKSKDYLKKIAVIIWLVKTLRNFKNLFARFLNISILSQLPFTSKLIGGPRAELRTESDFKLYIKERQTKGENVRFWHFFDEKLNLKPPILTLGSPIKEAEVQIGDVNTGELFFQLSNAKFYYHYHFFLTNDDKLVVPVSSVYSSERLSHVSFSFFKLPKTRYLKGTSLIMNNGHNYYHTMIDGVPTLYLAEMAGYKLDEIDHFVFFELSDEMFLNVISRTGIPKNKIINLINKDENIEFEKLLVGTMFERNGAWYRDYIIQKLGIQFKDKNEGLPSLIYISRAKAKMRRILNEDEVVAFLTQYGFEVVYNEDLSLEQQTQLYHHAKCIISTHGANLVNVLFCQSETKLVEIRYYKHTKYYNRVYFRMANAFNLPYYLIYCDQGKVTKSYIGVETEAESDMIVNIDFLKQIIVNMELNRMD